MRSIVFENSSDINYSIYLSEDEMRKSTQLRSSYKTHMEFYLFCKDGDEVVGWSFGYQRDAEEFYMANSAVLKNYRKQGIYTKMLYLITTKAIETGFQFITSNHNMTNNSILIPKLKFGFKISGMELHGRFGTMVKLNYCPNENVGKIYDYRTGQIKRLPYYVRPAELKDMDAIFRMGFDVWNEGNNLTHHFERCYTSPKYAKGKWYLLENEEGRPVSSLIGYEFDKINEKRVLGIGTIATNPNERKKGFGEKLIRGFINICPNTIFYLWSDINPSFYEKFGFEVLPQKYQTKSGSIVMIRAEKELIKSLLDDPKYLPPGYF